MNRVQQFLSVALFVVAASQIAIGVVSFTSGAATGNPLDQSGSDERFPLNRRRCYQIDSQLG